MKESKQSAGGHDREDLRQADISVGVERRKHSDRYEP
jgi:hypothetical protein